jgi:hypothetical protein
MSRPRCRCRRRSRTAWRPQAGPASPTWGLMAVRQDRPSQSRACGAVRSRGLTPTDRALPIGAICKAWFNSQDGDRRAGAAYWAANRSVSGHASCYAAATGDKVAFIAGCEEAERRLNPIDDRRHNGPPQYRAGLNDEASRLPVEPVTPPIALAQGGTPALAAKATQVASARRGPSFRDI